MAQAHPQKEARTFERMNGRSLLLCSNKMTHYFKEWTTASDVLKKIYFLQKFDASNRCFLLAVAIFKANFTLKLRKQI